MAQNNGCVLPDPPRRLSVRENRGMISLIIIGLILLIGITVLIPGLQEEERLARRRAEVWNDGSLVYGVIEAKIRSGIGRKVVRYRYQVAGGEYADERVIGHVNDFNTFEVGKSLSLRVDPSDPGFSVLDVDVAQSFGDWLSVESLIGLVFLIGGVMTLWGFHRRRVLCYGIEVPCTVQRVFLPGLVRVKYRWRGVERTRLVEGGVMQEGMPAVVLLDPTFSSLPVLGLSDRFEGGQASLSDGVMDSRRRWASAMMVGSVGAWVMWGVLLFFTGEAIPSYWQKACALIVGLFLVFTRSSPIEINRATGEAGNRG